MTREVTCELAGRRPAQSVRGAQSAAIPRRTPSRCGRSLSPVVGVLAVLAVAAALAVAPACLAAQDPARGVRIGLSYAPGTKPGVIVAPVAGPSGDSLQAILQRDLDFGDRVAVVTGAGVLSAGSSTGAVPNYALLGKLGAAALVVCEPLGGGRVRVTVHDVGAQRAIESRESVVVASPPGRAWRLSVHRLADEIERTITGTAGVAASRIAYVKGGRVWVIDSDGATTEAVSDGSALSPAWRPDGGALAWSTMGDAGSRIVVKDLATGKARVLAATPAGLNITPAFVPGGETIVYAHGREDGTDLWAAHAGDDEPARRVTVGRGSDNTSPTISPDGQRVAFTSGRSGRPEVYISDLDGTNVELLSDFAFDEQNYRAGPDWSPDGRAIAFQMRVDGVFQLAVISLRDRAVKVLTSDGKNEDPSWAPDGRHLVFTSNRSGAAELFVIDVETGRVRQLTHDRGARLAAWSPRLAASR